jgi:ATP-dependent Lon protease
MRTVLDEDHSDLQDVKDRIVEYLAVRKLVQERGVKTEPGEEALRLISQAYTREAGVRNLEREIGSICRSPMSGIWTNYLTRCARR